MRLRWVRSNWDQLARKDPLWAVLSYEDRRGGKWDVDEFLATGEQEIQAVLAEIERLEVPMTTRRALDFGCGAGRLTQALAAHFDEAVGVDIAPAMVETAERLNRRGERCRFLLNDRPDLAMFGDASFDLVYSNITLQHVPPAYTRRYLDEFLRVLVPGGMLVFQLPTGPPAGVASLKRFLPTSLRAMWAGLRAGVGRPKMQMYWLTRTDVEAALGKRPHRVLAAHSDRAAGEALPSSKYYVRREKGDGD